VRAVEEYDCVASGEEVFGGGGTARADGEVVKEADGVGFEGCGCAAGGEEDDGPGGGLRVDECGGVGGGGGEGGGSRVGGKVCF